MSNHGVMTVRVPFRAPKQQHRKWDSSGKLIYNNQEGEDRRIKIPTVYEVQSDYWWAEQRVTDIHGTVWTTDVFQYNEFYVILMTDGTKIQVVNDGGINWHVVKGEIT